MKPKLIWFKTYTRIFNAWDIHNTISSRVILNTRVLHNCTRNTRVINSCKKNDHPSLATSIQQSIAEGKFKTGVVYRVLDFLLKQLVDFKQKILLLNFQSSCKIRFVPLKIFQIISLNTDEKLLKLFVNRFLWWNHALTTHFF